MRLDIVLAALPLALAGSSSVKLCTKKSFGGKCDTVDYTWQKCYKIKQPFYHNLHSAKAAKTITRIYSAPGCVEHEMIDMLTSPSDGKKIMSGKKAEYILVQQCTGC